MAGDKAATDSTNRRASSRIAAQPPKSVASTAPSSAVTNKRKADASKETQPTKKASNSSKTADVKADEPSEKTTGAKGGDQLQVGDALPALTLKDEAGNDVEIGQLKKVVLFLYPKANTPGCTNQACLYRDNYSEFEKIGYDIWGLSNDNVGPLKSWKEKKSFPYRLLSDPSRILIGKLTGNKTKTMRSHIVVDSQSKVSDIKLSVKPAESSEQALEAAKKAQ